MYKKILATILGATMLFTVGCGKEDTSDVVLDPTTLADQMMEVFKPQGEMLALSPETIDNYYDIDPTVVTNYKVYVSTSFIGEELAVFELVEGTDLDTVLDQRLQDMKDSFDGYLPEELSAVNDTGEVLTNGNVICFIVGDNDGTQGAKDLFTSAK